MDMTETAQVEIDEGAFNLETLRGDIRDGLLARLKTQPKPWSVMSETEQQTLIDGCDRLADNLVRKAVDMLAANGRDTIQGTLEQYTHKDEIKAVIKIGNHAENTESLREMVGGRVLIVSSDPSQFLGQKDEAKPDPDQKEIFKGDETDGENVKPFKGKD